MKRKILVTTIFLFIFNFTFGDVRLDFSKKTPVNIALRSALFPGWGQITNQQHTKGYILLSSVVTSLGLSGYFYNQAQDTYKKYELKGVKDDPLYNEYSSHIDKANIFLSFGMALWIFSIFDAYIVAKNKMKYGHIPQAKFKNLFMFTSERKILFSYTYFF